jgi:hypothetical protein
MNARQPIGLAATSPKALAYQPPIELNDDADWLAEISFADLLDMRDDASEQGDWRGLEEIDCELRTRRAEAVGKLMALFVAAVDARTVVLMPSERGVSPMTVLEYLAGVMGTNEGTGLAVRMALGERAAVIAQLAADYARDNVEDLLRAGWTA